MYEYKCKMVRVVDGDTVDVDIDLGFGVWLRKQRIRMYGIDTPESRTSDDEEKIYGKAASAFLTKWTNAGDLTLKTFKDGKGKYGRILGELWYGGEHNINQLLVDNHHNQLKFLEKQYRIYVFFKTQKPFRFCFIFCL